MNPPPCLNRAHPCPVVSPRCPTHPRQSTRGKRRGPYRGTPCRRRERRPSPRNRPPHRSWGTAPHVDRCRTRTPTRNATAAASRSAVPRAAKCEAVRLARPRYPKHSTA
eukprot:6736468-Prymnesium_polylepis.1